MVKQTEQTGCSGLAIACVPIQQWQRVYSPEAAFYSGTIFPELNLPYNPPGSNSSAGMQRGLDK